MFDPDQTTHVGTLRQACKLYANQVELLTKRLEEALQELVDARGLSARQIELLLPEPLVVHSESVAQEAAPTAGPVAEQRQPQRGHGPTPRPALPRQTRKFEIVEDDRSCPSCGNVMGEMKGQTEDAEEITLIERKIVVTLNKRQKYRCQCNGAVMTAAGAPKLVPGGLFSLDFAVSVAVDKYADHIPLERQVRRFERQGLEVTSQTLWDQIEGLARHLAPTYEALQLETLAAPVVGIDETGWAMLVGEKAKRCPWTVWGLTTPSSALYRLIGSKSELTAREILRGYCGTLVADGYIVYRNIAEKRAGPGGNPRLANCWAHVLRKFREVDANEPGRAKTVLDLIGKIYDVEVEVGGPFPGDAETCARRARLRDEKSRALIAEIRDWAFAQGGLRRSDFGAALSYMLERWDALTLFLEDPRIPVDNNATERALRGVVLGRKNHYGSKSKRGTEVAALFYSLIETAKLRGVDPLTYLRRAAVAAVRQPGTPTLPAAA